MKVNIELDALVHNATVLNEKVGVFYAVLKCDAYGHGAVSCAKALYESGVRHYAVFSLAEALEIHPFVGNSEILILGRTDASELATVGEKGFVQTVFSEEYAREIIAHGYGTRLHVKIDTGMNRSGFPADGERVFSILSTLGDNVDGVYTHFPRADEKDISDTEERLSFFLKTVDELEVLLGRKLKKHSAASAAALRLPAARLDVSRIGLALYGISPDNSEPPSLKPVMSLYGTVSGIRTVKKGDTVGYGCRFTCKRDSIIATVDGGYANGVRRSLVGRFKPRIFGKLLPLAAVCMDRCMLDVTDLFLMGKEVRAGETVTFFGNGHSVKEMAVSAKTIPYEILTLAGKTNAKSIAAKQI